MPGKPSVPRQVTGPSTDVLAPHPAAESRWAQERELWFEGFRYTCRVVHQPHADLPPTVILGGSSQDRNSWVRHERWLAGRSSVLTVDLPGYGDSDALPARYGMGFLADAVRHMLRELGVTRVNLVGACFGGAISVRLAQRYPELLNRLVLVGMAPRVPEDYTQCVERWTEMLADGGKKEIADELVQRFVANPDVGKVRRGAAVARLLYRDFLGQDERQLTLWLEHNARLVQNKWCFEEPLPEVPVLVTTGEFDTLALPESGRAMAEWFSSALFVLIREADHLAPVERVAEFSALVARFCGGESVENLDFCSEVERVGPVSPSDPARARGRAATG